ncbi:hypothetical protein HanRHA438_Chr14g0673731 [Helianthus annuus]|nr:hypothetical protein HanIR_Chr14g0718971 [Helianthus annuus]KAJ0855468.1 hypothetical protein HanRHA438_Chr14g0673731 [Helianthus annuus]
MYCIGQKNSKTGNPRYVNNSQIWFFIICGSIYLCVINISVYNYRVCDLLDESFTTNQNVFKMESM